jgi:hypothetical protein
VEDPHPSLLLVKGKAGRRTLIIISGSFVMSCVAAESIDPLFDSIHSVPVSTESLIGIRHDWPATRVTRDESIHSAITLSAVRVNRSVTRLSIDYNDIN